MSIPAVCKMFSGYAKVRYSAIGPTYGFYPGQGRVVKCLKNFAPDILYSPVEKKLPNFGNIPRVVMVQNMEPLLPFMKLNSSLQNLRLLLLKWMAGQAVRDADHVIALSKFVRDHLSANMGVPVNRITQISHGVDINRNIVARPPVSIDIGDSFIFTAGTISPARGLEDIILAFVNLKKGGEFESLKLYIAGGVPGYSKGYSKKLRNIVSKNDLTGDVIWLGFEGQPEMKWCFRHCEVFVMTSRMESFGITAAEAMANGARVVSTNSPCLPEVFGNYASYYNAGDYQSLAGELESLLKENQETRQNRGAEAPQELPGECSRFNWDRAYNETMDLFLGLVKQKSNKSR